MILEIKKKRLISEYLPVKKPPAPPKVTPLHATNVRSRVIYISYRGGAGVDAPDLEALPD